MNFLNTFLTVLGMIFVIAVISALPTMLLWNWLMPVLFGLKQITFLQALGINILCGILFKNTNSNNK